MFTCFFCLTFNSNNTEVYIMIQSILNLPFPNNEWFYLIIQTSKTYQHHSLKLWLQTTLQFLSLIYYQVYFFNTLSYFAIQLTIALHLQSSQWSLWQPYCSPIRVFIKSNLLDEWKKIKLNQWNWFELVQVIESHQVTIKTNKLLLVWLSNLWFFNPKPENSILLPCF